MALAYVGGTSNTGTGATYDVDLSGLGLQEGDIVIVATGWASEANGDPGVDEAGYTELGEYYSSSTRDANAAFAWKIMGGTPDANVTVRGPSDGQYGGATAVHAWRGVDQSTPIDTASTLATGIVSARPNGAAITPVTDGAVILSAGLGTGDTSPQAFTAPTDFLNGISAAGAGSVMSAIACMASYEDWTSGSYNPAGWTLGETTADDSYIALTIALRPAATATGKPNYAFAQQ